MQPVPRARKHAAGVNGGKTCNQCQGRKNIHLAPRTKKHASGGPRDELSAGKHEPGAKGRGGEDMQPVPNKENQPEANTSHKKYPFSLTG